MFEELAVVFRDAVAEVFEKAGGELKTFRYDPVECSQGESLT